MPLEGGYVMSYENSKDDILEREVEIPYPLPENSQENYLAKLTLALTIPAVCSRYILRNDNNSKNYPEHETNRYPKWCEEYLDFQPLTSKEVYAVRCSLLHHGDDDVETQKVLRTETRANHYNLIIPYSDGIMNSNESGLESDNVKSFCATGLIPCLLTAYRKFKEEYPDFKYPLEP